METVRVDYFTRSIKAWSLCLIECVFFMPLFLLTYSFLVPEQLSLLALCSLSLMSLAGVTVRSALPVFWKRAGASVLLGTLFAVAIGGLGNGTILGVMVCLFAGTVLAYQGVTSAGRTNQNKLYKIGIGLYLLAGILFPRFTELEGFMPFITWVGVLCLAWTLFAVNRSYLRYNTFSEEEAGNRLPRGLRGHNMTWIGAIVLAALLLATGAGRWAGGVLLGMLRQIVGWLTRSSGEPVTIPEEDTGGPAAFPMETGKSHEPGWLSQFLNILFYLFATAVILALVAVVLYWLYKNAGGIWRRWMDRLLAMLGRAGKAERNEAFVDEEIRLKMGKSMSPKWQNWRGIFGSRSGKKVTLEDLPDNRERIRYLYRHLLHAEQAQGYQLKPYFTPQETETELRQQPVPKSREGKSAWGKRRSAAKELLGLYYKARYKEQEPTDDEIARIKRELDL